MENKIARFHYLTQDVISGKDHVQLAMIACKAGARWVQLRSKLLPYPELIKTATAIKKITDSIGAVLIINDHVGIAKEVMAHGVHLGKEDVKPVEARKSLGADCIIGLTINSEEDAMKNKNAPVNYFGMGPYRYTTTKKNLSSVLRKSEIQNILEILSPKPVIAIGGIQLEDIKDIMNAGIYGFAVSSAINLSENLGESVKRFCEEMEDC